MMQEIFIMALWGVITFVLLVDKAISLEYAYIGMCIMLAVGLLHKEK